MCSKTSKIITAALLASAFILTACEWHPFKNLRLGDKSPAPGSLQLNLKMSCMSEVGKKVDAYLAGQMAVGDIQNFMGCIRGALTKFTTFEKSRAAGYYTPTELANFLNRNYLREEVLTPAFAAEIMKIKVLIVGGDLDKITDGEIGGLINLVTFFENEAIANLQYIPLYFKTPGLDVSKLKSSDFENMRVQLQETSSQLATKLSSQEVNYDMSSFEAFLTELRKFLHWDEYRPSSQTPEQTVRLISAYKTIVTGKSDSVIRPEQWAPLFDTVSSLFSIWVTCNIELHDVTIAVGPGLQALVDTVNEAVMAIGRIVDRNSPKMISFAASDNLIDALAETNLLPAKVRPGSIKQAYKFLVQKAFRNPMNISRGGVQAQGLGWSELNEMHHEFDLWADGQKYLNDNAARSLQLQSGVGGLFKEFGSSFQGFDFRQFIFNGVDQGDKRADEIVRIVDFVPPFFRIDDSRAYILPTDEMARFGVFDSVADLTRMNTIRGLIRLLIRGAGTDDRIMAMSRDWLHTGITEDEMQSFFDNVHDLTADLKLIDPRKTNTGSRSFQEAKLFTYDGNGLNNPDPQGSELLNFVQGMEYLATIWSGGKVRDLVYKHIDELCRAQGVQPGPVDPFGVARLDRRCFERNFFNDGLTDFANLPHLRDDFLKRSAQERQEIVRGLETIAKGPCSNSSYIELGEIATISTVLHYVEVVFSVYDKDHDGVLSGEEVMHAFKRFSGFIARKAQEKTKTDYSVAMIKAIYAYLVEHGELPTGWGALSLYVDKFRYFNNDINQYEGDSTDSAPDLSVDRAKLINVLKILTASGSSTPAPGVCAE